MAKNVSSVRSAPNGSVTIVYDDGSELTLSDEEARAVAFVRAVPSVPAPGMRDKLHVKVDINRLVKEHFDRALGAAQRYQDSEDALRG